MPVHKCTKDGKSGWAWGSKGTCYTGKDGKKRAQKQGVAAHLNGYKGSWGEDIPTQDEIISMLISDISENDPFFYEICKDLNLTVGSITLLLEKKKEDRIKKKTKYPNSDDEDEDENEEDVNDDDEEDED